MIKSANADLAGYLSTILASVPDRAFLEVDRVLDRTVPPDWGHPTPLRLQAHHLTLIKSGRAFFKVNDVAMPLERGSVLFASQGCMQSWEQDHDDPPSMVTIRFFLRTVLGGEKAQPQSCRPCAYTMHPRHPHRFVGMFEQLHEAWHRCPGQDAIKATQGLLVAILWSLRKECLLTAKGVQDSLMEDVRRLLESEPTVNWSVNDLAKRYGISRNHLGVRFRLHTGHSPKTYQLHSRMRYARQLLRGKKMMVREVADVLGYSDPFAFSRQFKKIWGIPPSQV